MSLITTVFVAIGLSMDAFAVSIVGGSTHTKPQIKQALRTAGFFGAFQAAMPLIGYLAATSIKQLISSYDHWVAFLILAGVGSKTTYESLRFEGNTKRFNTSNLYTLVALSTATSVDALAIGITLCLLAASIVTAAAIIGTVTFVLSYIGATTGAKLGHSFGNKLETAGGIILIGLGVKILLEHTYP